jgi:hypothetical protein
MAGQGDGRHHRGGGQGAGAPLGDFPELGQVGNGIGPHTVHQHQQNFHMAYLLGSIVSLIIPYLFPLSIRRLSLEKIYFFEAYLTKPAK